MPNAKPVFVEDNKFTTTIPLQYVSLSYYQDEWIKWLELKDEFNEYLALGLCKIALNSSCYNKAWENILLFLVPRWHKKGTQLITLNWDENQLPTKDVIKRVPSF